MLLVASVFVDSESLFVPNDKLVALVIAHACKIVMLTPNEAVVVAAFTLGTAIDPQAKLAATNAEIVFDLAIPYSPCDAARGEELDVPSCARVVWRMTDER